MSVELIAQKVAKSPLIVSQNRFADYLRAVCSEWLQLVLVTERIKCDDAGGRCLKELIDVVNRVMKNRLVTEFYKNHPDGISPFSGRHLHRHIVLDGVLSHFFEALDENKTMQDYTDDMSSYCKNNPDPERGIRYEPTRNKVISEVIPDILKECQFSWRNLNALRLGYPHSKIIFLVLNHESLMESIENALSFIENDKVFEDFRMKLITDYIVKKNGENKWPENFNADDLVYRPDLVSGLNDEILKAAADKTILLSQATSMSFSAIPEWHMLVGGPELFEESPSVASNNIAGMNHIEEYLKGKDVLKVHLEYEGIKGLYKDGCERFFLLELRERLRAKISPGRMEVNYQYQMLQQSLDEVRRCNFILLQAKKNKCYLAASTILRGARYSHWLWINASEVKGSILNKAEKYCSEKNKTGGEDDGKPLLRATTVKQSYEDIRKHARDYLVPLVLSQVEERQHLYTALLPVLNNRITEECENFVTELKKMLPEKISLPERGFRWYLATGEKIRQKLLADEKDGVDFRDYRLVNLLNCFGLDEATIQNLVEESRQDSNDCFLLKEHWINKRLPGIWGECLKSPLYLNEALDLQ
ncbi:hypothetical protein OVA10_23025 [Lelliottia sp. SL45]|uniref:hypothetical protein n=2 Tax=Enterobacteriaceae TaxID=543 RepID=UPI0022743322|nr:hypothetical protein [Lelliottia sp. SL45]MCY1700903.1 hypothetical protein [Lelliottia sp. SL45]